MKMLGARLMVEDIVTTLSMEVRAQRAGLELVLENDHRPRPTLGRVITVGSDPLLQEEVKVGDIVFFAPTAGTAYIIGGRPFRALEHQEVTMTMTNDEYEDTLKASV